MQRKAQLLIDDSGLTITLPDGRSEFWVHPQTRESCRCSQCWYPFQLRRALDLKDTVSGLERGADPAVKALSGSVDESEGVVRLQWSDGHTGVIWLRSFQQPRRSSRELWRERETLWHRSSEIWGKSNVYHYQLLLADHCELRRCLEQLTALGVVRIEGTQTAANILQIVQDLALGPPTSSLFGTSFVVGKRPGVLQKQ